MSLEQDLQRALRRKPAPDDLADRVLARLAPASARSTSAGLRRSSSISSMATGGHHAWRWLAAAAAVVLVATGSARYYAERQAAAEAERVKEEIRLALVETSLETRLPGGSRDDQDRQDTP
jgi:hypothetical protein